jgi:hypothetical protein
MAVGTLVTGQRATAGTNGVDAAQRKIDMAQQIMLLEPESSPLTVILKTLQKKRCFAPKYSWFEKELDPRFDTANGAQTNVSTTIVVTNAGYWEAQGLMYVPRTGELIRIVSNAAGTLTVVRGVGSTAAAINNGEELLAAGNAALEGDTSRAGRSRNPTKVDNYTQIFRTPWEETDTALHTEYEADDDWDRQAADHGIEHAKNIEYALMLGRPSEDLTDASGKPRRSTGGFNHFVTTNVTDFAGATTELGFYTALRPIFRYGAKEKVGLASMLAVDILNTYPRGKIQISNPDQNKYGLKVMQFVSPHGTLNLVTHYLLEGATLGKQLWVLDPNNAEYRYLQNKRGSRDTHIKTNIQTNDTDGRKDEYLTECGGQFGLDKTHGKLINFG